MNHIYKNDNIYVRVILFEVDASNNKNIHISVIFSSFKCGDTHCRTCTNENRQLYNDANIYFLNDESKGKFGLESLKQGSSLMCRDMPKIPEGQYIMKSIARVFIKPGGLL